MRESPLAVNVLISIAQDGRVTAGLYMAYLVKSADVFVGGEIVFDGDQARFSGGRNIGVVPALYDCNGHYVEPVNQWFLRLVAGKGLQDLSSYSRAMLRYWSFLERHDDLQWDKFLPAKALANSNSFEPSLTICSAYKGFLIVKYVS